MTLLQHRMHLSVETSLHWRQGFQLLSEQCVCTYIAESFYNGEVKETPAHVCTASRSTFSWCLVLKFDPLPCQLLLLVAMKLCALLHICDQLIALVAGTVLRSLNK